MTRLMLTGAVGAELCRNVTIYGSCKFEGKGQAIAAIAAIAAMSN